MKPRDLSDHIAYEAGRGIEEVARERGRDPSEFIKLASNENPHGPSPDAVTAIRNTAASVNSYPKAAHADLGETIADRWQVTAPQVWLANGADGAIDYLMRATLEPGDDVLVPDPGFAYYGMSARFHHGDVRTYELSKSDDFDQNARSILEQYDGERIVYLTSPHNPSGSTISLEDVVTLARETDEETLVVVDEAYGEFADVESATAVIEGRNGFESRTDVAVLRTFSKAYGLAGVRLGYALVPAEWADAYTRVNTPFAASELACRAGLAALEDDEHVRKTVDTVEWAREYMHRELGEASLEETDSDGTDGERDIRVWPSGGNFVLIDVGDASEVTEKLQERGVIVRDCSSFGLPGCIRITCGTRAETERAVSTLQSVLAGQTAGGPQKEASNELEMTNDHETSNGHETSNEFEMTNEDEASNEREVSDE